MVEPMLSVDVEVERGQRNPFVLRARFEAPRGITVLVGPSGAGKSTTLAAIAGLVRPSAGVIRFDEELWFDARRGVNLPIEARGIALVFQSLALFPHLTALGNVEYGIERGLPRAERRRRAEEMLEKMRVGHLSDRRPATFSGGEAQRVALARAFARRPRLVLLDEPFSALDRQLRREFVAEVRAYAEGARLPLLYVTHHRNEARALAERVVLLSQGRVEAVGEPDALLAEADATEQALGLPLRG